MKYWLATEWPAADAGENPLRPSDLVIICPFDGGRIVLPEFKPRRAPLADRWPQEKGAIVVARVINPPAAPEARRPLSVDRDPNCWIRVLDMKLPNYDGFDPTPEIDQILDLEANARLHSVKPKPATLYSLSEDQYDQLLRLFATRQWPD